MRGLEGIVYNVIENFLIVLLVALTVGWHSLRVRSSVVSGKVGVQCCGWAMSDLEAAKKDARLGVRG